MKIKDIPSEDILYKEQRQCKLVGNSIALFIPRNVCSQFNINEHTLMDMIVTDDGIHLRDITEKQTKNQQ